MAEDSIALDSVENAEDFCAERAKEIELEIERLGIVLEIDWRNEAQVRELAKEALNHVREEVADYEHDRADYREKAKVTLFALAAMMMDIMARSANKGIHTHGGVAWKAFSKALMLERGIPLSDSESSRK